ncbi:MAG: DUF1579 domain-containing protein [Alphaproteobacteria bacterium]|nr:DUF1579 domain-containing protein [Alphaproteobacteria bacterium]
MDRCADFDFLFGSRTVSHRRLRRRLVGDTQWEELSGVTESRLIVGGLGNGDDSVIELPAGTYRAEAIRAFDSAQRLWSIWWIDSRFPGLGPPGRGGFEQGIDIFFGDDELDGHPIRVRFTWSEITSRSARWEQAFSADGEASWEINGIMNFTRVR